MPTEITHYECDVCRLPYKTRESAEECEGRHAEKRAALDARCAKYLCAHLWDHKSPMPACHADCHFCDRGPHACHFSVNTPAPAAQEASL